MIASEKVPTSVLLSNGRGTVHFWGIWTMGIMRQFALNSTDVDFIWAQVTFASVELIGYDLITGQALYGYVDATMENNAPSGPSAIIQSETVLPNGDAAYLFTNINNGVITLLNGTGDGAVTYSGTPVNNGTPTGPDYNYALDYRGIRIASGAYNNLDPDHQGWGASETPFLRFVPADYTHYITQNTGSARTSDPVVTGTDANGNPIYDPSVPASLSDAFHVGIAPGVTDSSSGVLAGLAGSTDYTVAPVTDGSGNVIGYTMNNIVDYTPRMISQTISTEDALARSGAPVITHPYTYNNDDWRSVSYVHNGVTYASGDPSVPLETYLPNVNSVAGNAPVSGVFVLFGQFFDHGLDFISKNSGYTIKIPLAVTDPLYGTPGPDGQPTTYLTVDRADPSGFDAAGNPTYLNHDSPYIDQSQTYGSDDQITSLLREWVVDPNTGEYVPGAKMFDGHQIKPYLAANLDGTDKTDSSGNPVMTTNTLPTLKELRAYLLATGRDDLTWDDINNFRARDAQGHVLFKTDGTPIQIDEAVLLDKNPHFDAAHIDLTNPILAAAVADGTLVLDPSGTVSFASLMSLINFADFSIIPTDESSEGWKVANELLLESVGDHYIAGDGRANENFGLTALHHVFHEEHNFQVDKLESIIEQELAADPTHTAGHVWQEGVTASAADQALGSVTLAGGQVLTVDAKGYYEDANWNYTDALGNISWNQDEIFKGAQLIVTMEYQHIAIDQYARLVTPDLPAFVTYDAGLNSNITIEYAESAFRFGHSQLRETIDTIDPSGGITGQIVKYALEDAFLNPTQFANVGAGAILSGMSEQVSNETDEFVTPALQQSLLGQPLDLAAINIARGRDLGIPTLNQTRAAIYNALSTDNSTTISVGELAPYVSWADFQSHMAHPDAVVNFIAAYAFDGDLTAASAAVNDAEFMNGGNQDFNKIDLWIGGLAEAHVYGGILGSTFNAIFLDQMERLQDGDRFYYFYRLDAALLQTTNLNNEIINQQFKDIIERNTGARHLGGDVMSYTDSQIELAATPKAPADANGYNYQAQHAYGDILAAHPTLGVYSGNGPNLNANGNIVTIKGVQYIYDARPDGNGGGDTNLDGTPSSGYNAHEVIVGTANNDYIDAGNGDDTVYGDAGNDILTGGPGADHLYGGDGNDILYGGDNEDFLDGGNGNDTIYGGTSGGITDIIIGGAGDDVLYGESGIDNLYGGTGNDTMYGGGETDVLEGEAGNDVMYGGDGPDAMNGGEGDDILYGGPGDDSLDGQQGDDILHGGTAIAGNNGDVLDGGTSIGWGNGGYNLTAYDDITTNLKLVIDLTQENINLAGALGATYINIQGAVGSQYADTIIGEGTADTTISDNWLIGGGGNDTLKGGGGNDILVGGSIRLDAINALATSQGFVTEGSVNHFTDLLSTNPNFVLGDGGAGGSDTVLFSGVLANYTFTYLPAVTSAILTTPGSATTITPSAIKVVDTTGADGVELLVGISKLKFSDGVTITVGPAAAPTVKLAQDTGASATDRYTSNPALTGTGGAFGPVTATIDGTIVVPVAVAANGTWSVTPSLTDGTHTVVVSQMDLTGATNSSAPLTFTLDTTNPAVTEALLNDSGASSSDGLTNNPALTGSGDPNAVVTLTEGATTLGTTTADGTGAWTFTPSGLTQGAHTITATETDLAGNVGTAALTFTLDTVLPVVTVALTSDTGSSSTDGITSNPALSGTGDANTAVFASIDGGAFTQIATTNAAGAWTFADTGLSQGTHNVQVRQTDLAGNVGTSGTLSFTYDSVIQTPTITNLADVTAASGLTSYTVTGTTDANAAVRLTNGATLLGTATASATGAWSITVTPAASINFVRVLTLTATDAAGNTATSQMGVIVGNNGVNALTATGPNATIPGLDTIPDLIVGLSGNDTLTGGSGNDRLDGGAGIDSMAGGAGDDTYVVDNTSDVVTENPNAGTDTVLTTTASYTLGDNVENLTYTGASNFTGKGNALANVITGGVGADTLTGGTNTAGVDTLIGGLGSDTYVTSNVGDVIVETAGGGTDTVKTTLGSYTLGANLENLTYTGSGSFAGTGNELANTITGGSGADTLDGGVNTTGADTLIGGAGNDTYYIRNPGDTIFDSSGTDTALVAINSYTLANNVENMTFIGSGAFTGVGNTADNIITGGAGADLLRGGAGNDTLIGGAGADTLQGATGNDVFQLVKGDANGDLITDFTHGQDLIKLVGYASGASLMKISVVSGVTSYTVQVGGVPQDTFKLNGNITLASNDYMFS